MKIVTWSVARTAVLFAAATALPAVWGVYGNLGAGRVYLDGDSPGGWHSGGGGGIWLAMLDHHTALSLGVEASSEGTLLQAGTAFGF